MQSGAADGRDLVARVAKRWEALDPLLPVPVAARPGCGLELIVEAAGGRPAAVGSCEHWAGLADSLDLTWGAARRFQLTPLVAELDGTGALDRLLSLWREHVAVLPGADADDTSAVVTWPSRDVHGVQELLAHGLAPLAVIAARATVPADSAGAAGAAGEHDGVRIRRAGPADIGEVLRLGLDVVRFDALVSGVTLRPSTRDALRRDLALLLAEPEPWVWLAETADKDAVGMLAAERPEVASWIAPMSCWSPVAYLLLMGVSSDRRRRGMGAAMAAHLHHAVEAAGIPLTLLHYAQVNPLSAPFWSQQGYRPLWTVWEAVPARTLR
jgi:GNAT superfamily N-acetyltransferase